MFDKRLFRLVPGIGRLIAGKVACLWIGLVCNIVFMITVVALFGDVLAPWLQGTDNPPFAWILTICVVLRYIATTVAAHLGTEASERVKLALRGQLYRKMLKLGPSYSTRVSTSDIVQSAGEGVEQIQSFFELFLPQVFYAVLAPITLFFFVSTLNTPAALTLLVCAPLIVLIVGMVAMSASRAFKQYWGKYTDMGAAFLDDLQGLETLKAFDADDGAARDLDEKAERFRVMTMKVLQIQLRSLSAMDLVAYVGAASGIGVALWQFATTKSLSVASVVLIAMLSAEFFIPLRQLGSYFHVAMNGMTSSKRIFALLDAPEPKHGEGTLAGVGKSIVAIAFDSVSYTYDDGRRGAKRALDEASFYAAPGQLTTIVGASGSGKSTAAALLAGARSGYTGSIIINGTELADLSAETLSRTVTLVGAHSHLFAGTLRENLLLANPKADDAAMWRALVEARVAAFVHGQPGELDMVIEPDAANLSGGQRQRIAIARALLHDSPVYVFDEATSSVDVESENLILQTIYDLAHGQHKTVIMITHRMVNAERADHVVVFERGHAVESGSHVGLMAVGGAYAKLHEAQRSVERFADVSSAENDAIAAPSDFAGAGARRRAAAGGDEPNEPETPELPTSKVVSRLLHEARPLAGLMTAASAAGTVGHLAATFLPVFGVVALFDLAGKPVWGMSATVAVIAMAVCALTRGVLRYVEQYLNHNVAFRLLALFRSKAFAALRRLAPAKLAGRGKGDLIAMLTTDVELLEIFFAHTISPVVIAVVTTIVTVVVALTLNPWMALLLLAAHLVVGVAVPRFFSAGVRNLGPSIRGQASELDEAMLDDMRGLGEIIRFGRGEERASRIEERTRKLWRERAKLSRRNGMFSGIGGVMVMLFTLAGAGVALLMIAQGAGLQLVMTAFVLIASSFGPTLALAALPANLSQTFASARRLFALMDEAPAVVEEGSEKPKYKGMSMRNVTFAYAQGAGPVLDGFSLTVPKHGVLGVQGASGRGKSTMVKLLMRYWDPQSGEVRLSDCGLPQVDAHHRRRVQALMSQETHLFDGTIRDNLLMALPAGVAVPDGNGHPSEALEHRLREACRKASVLDFIDSLPEGLDTQVGELGDRLSEGERQRIGLARVFLREADVVLFDEPTSRLDALNEAIILQSIDELAHGGSSQSHSSKRGRSGGGKAVVLVSHRASAMRIADKVLKM
ncbi:ATP-binding cassette domain-containing protein [Bifidobacterium sp. 64T4]|uniref:ABC transporter ATP-binding protein/permease n=1 Tax=Bifidobacterium pongonis TaxID=2834432 RepID=UPI001C57E3C7|nr:ATP-binding cassette domain-containing protein [Bifidobacterium pongonis]MBW3094652.1 ATP-binding cassette domain-containing protein [Bifidobacterium pongonis]